MLQGYLYLVTCVFFQCQTLVWRFTKRAFLSELIVVIFHAFTGLQCRLQGYLNLVARIVSFRTKRVFGSSPRVPFVNLRRDFHAFTGLQYRFQGYLNLVAFIVSLETDTSPCGRFSSVCHQILWIYI